MLDFLKELIKIDTSKKENYEKTVKLIKEKAEELGIKAEIVRDEVGIPHVIIGEGETVILTHYDVVPPGEGWNFNPFEPFEKEGKIFGRGAADSKGNVVAALWAMKESEECREKFKLIVTGGEETGEAREFFGKIEAKKMIVLDSSVEYISFGACGIGRINIKVKGKSCHSAYPFKGKNAIYLASKLALFIEELSKEFIKKVSKYDAPPTTPYKKVPVRLNATMFNSGIAGNVIPGEARILVDVRIPPDFNPEEILKEIEEEIRGFCEKNKIDIEIESKVLIEGWTTKDISFAERIAKIANKPLCLEIAGTDGVFFYKRVPEIAQFGVIGEDNNIHAANEFVHIEDIVFTKEILKKIAKEVL